MITMGGGGGGSGPPGLFKFSEIYIHRITEKHAPDPPPPPEKILVINLPLISPSPRKKISGSAHDTYDTYNMHYICVPVNTRVFICILGSFNH